jgi:DNA-binding NarL/FixJ family response regulator
VSVLVDNTANLIAYRPARLTAMVVVADPRVRQSVTRHLWALGVRDVLEAQTAAEARSRMAATRDLAVVDIHLPDGSGLALLAEMRAAGWAGGLAVSAADDAGAVRAALASGVRGFVITGARPVAASRPGMNGMHGASANRVRPASGGLPPGAAALAAANSGGATQPHAGCRDLSAREIEVLRLVADGRSNKAIGQAMGLSALTVKSHLARIARKLGTGDRAGMVAVALRGGTIH